MPRSKELKTPNPLKVVVLGQNGVGKTCFIDMFLEGKHFIRHSAVDDAPLSRTISHANEPWSLSFFDENMIGDISPRYREVVEAHIASADGVVLLYDITCHHTFDHIVEYMYLPIWHCRNIVFIKDGTEGRIQGVKKRFGCMVVGNKKDIVDEDEEKREVRKEMAEQWAASQGFRHLEVSSNEQEEVEDVVRGLVDSVQRAGGWTRGMPKMAGVIGKGKPWDGAGRLGNELSMDNSKSSDVIAIVAVIKHPSDQGSYMISNSTGKQ